MKSCCLGVICMSLVVLLGTCSCHRKGEGSPAGASSGSSADMEIRDRTARGKLRGSGYYPCAGHGDEALSQIERRNCSAAEDLFAQHDVGCSDWTHATMEYVWLDLLMEVAACYEGSDITAARRIYSQVLALPNREFAWPKPRASAGDGAYTHIHARARLRALDAKRKRASGCVNSEHEFASLLRAALEQRTLNKLSPTSDRRFMLCTHNCADVEPADGLKWLQHELAEPETDIVVRREGPDCFVATGWATAESVRFLTAKVKGCIVWQGLQIPADCGS